MTETAGVLRRVAHRFRAGTLARAAFAAAWLVLPASLIAAPGQGESAPVFRIFLKDGTPLISYGEYTRTGDRVVFSVPLGSVASPEAFQVVSLPADAVDWARTARYTDAARYRRYAEARGDRDYTALTADVAQALTEIAITPDASAKLAIARRTRTKLIEWPRTHYGYRSSEVRDLALTMDEVISDALAELGENSFSFDLVAVLEPPDGGLLPAPSYEETIDSARAVTRLSDSPAERMSLQQAILSVLGTRRAAETHWTVETRGAVARELRRERQTDRAYASLAARAMRDASRLADQGDVAGVTRVMDDVRARDTRLGGQRTDQVVALMATLEPLALAARERRLELDRWDLRNRTHVAYRDATAAALRRLDGLKRDMDAIRTFAGPAPSRFGPLRTRLADVRRALAPLDPPADLREARDTLASAVALMDEAVRLRHDAVLAADRRLSDHASAAAAGGLLLLDRARSAIAAYFQRPGSS